MLSAEKLVKIVELCQMILSYQTLVLRCNICQARAKTKSSTVRSQALSFQCFVQSLVLFSLIVEFDGRIPLEPSMFTNNQGDIRCCTICCGRFTHQYAFFESGPFTVNKTSNGNNTLKTPVAGDPKGFLRFFSGRFQTEPRKSIPGQVHQFCRSISSTSSCKLENTDATRVRTGRGVPCHKINLLSKSDG